MLIRIIDGQPQKYTVGELLRDHPHVSFPRELTDAVIAQYQVYWVTQTPAPPNDSKTHRHTQHIELVGTEWTQVWSTVPLPLGQAVDNVRAHRDALLADTDWVVAVSYERGEAVPPAWVSYRQALRDVTAQTGFPYEVIWPTKPE